jgi:hypothetical protein
MLAFIYLVYSMMALLCETVPTFEDTWNECLGDLGRYRMAIEEITFEVERCGPESRDIGIRRLMIKAQIPEDFIIILHFWPDQTLFNSCSIMRRYLVWDQGHYRWQLRMMISEIEKCGQASPGNGTPKLLKGFRKSCERAVALRRTYLNEHHDFFFAR